MTKVTPGTISVSRVYEWYAQKISKHSDELTNDERTIAMFNYTASGQHKKDWSLVRKTKQRPKIEPLGRG